MKKKNPELSIKPQNLGVNSWYYEMPRYVNLVTYEKPDYNGGATHVKIPWSKLIQSVERYKEVKSAKAKAKLVSRLVAQSRAKVKK